MNATDALAITQQLQQQALATQSPQQTNQALVNLSDWLKKNVATRIGRGGRLGITVSSGIAVGLAYGALKHPRALVASAAAAAASGVAALMAKNPDWIDTALSVTAGVASAAAALETAKGTSEYIANRAVPKGSAVAQGPSAPAGSKKV